jgi:hypothetical protein
MKLTVLFLFAVFTAGAQSTTEHLPATDAGKIADAPRSINVLLCPFRKQISSEGAMHLSLGRNEIQASFALPQGLGQSECTNGFDEQQQSNH